MGQIDLKTKNKDRILRLEYWPLYPDTRSYQYCKIYLVTESEVTYLASRPLGMLLSKLLIAFIDIPDREYVSHKGMQNCFTISNLEDSLSTLLGNQTESGELELVFEGTHGDIIKLMTLTNEDKINWIEIIFEQLTK